ncbi:MAG: hypothetical protein ACK5LX_08535 [Oscillospiraceae bacterium]
MKKVLVCLIAVLLVVGMLPMSVAAKNTSPIIGFSAGEDMLDDKNVADFGQIILGTDLTVLEVPIIWQNFDFGGATPDKSLVNQEVMDYLSIEYTLQSGSDFWHVFVRRYIKMAWSASELDTPKIVFTAMNIGEIDGELTLVYTDPDTNQQYRSAPIDIKGAFIDPTINKHIVGITGINLADGRDTEFSPAVMLNGSRIPAKDLANLSLEPGDEIAFRLHTDFFDWDPDIYGMGASVRKSSLDNDHVKAIKTVLKGNDLIDTVAIENIDGVAYVIVRFKDELNMIKEREFDFNVALGQYGIRNEGSLVNLTGTIGNPIYEASMDNDYIYIGDGMVVEAIAACRNVQLDLGNGVVITLNLSQNKKYYGRASTTPTPDDKDIMNYYPTIIKAITLKTTGIENAAKNVKLSETTNYYVYDDEGIYLGRSDDELEYRNKYYLSQKAIDFNPDGLDVDAPDEEIDDYENDNPSTGGMPAAATGKTGFELIGLAAVAAGGLLLALKKTGKKSK